MITAHRFDGDGGRVVEDPGSLPELVAQPGVGVWVDLSDPSPADIDRVEADLGLHPLAVEDVSRRGQRPKLVVYDDHLFVVAYAAAATGDGIELVEVELFVGRDWLLTVHRSGPGGAAFDAAGVRRRLDRLAARSRPRRGSGLLYVVLDEIVDSYFDAVDAFGGQVDDIEDRIFADEDPEADEGPVQRRMLALRKVLLELRRRVVPLREVLLQLLRDDDGWVDDVDRHYFQNVLDHVLRITDEIDTRRELIGNAMEAHLAMVSNHMNEIMKRMTSWGAILIVATLVAGIYGMNFEHMPELRYRFGYPAALTAMAAVTAGLYWYFKRKRWL